MGIRIITDSAADFDPAVAKRRQVDVVPMSVQFGSASFLAGKNQRGSSDNRYGVAMGAKQGHGGCSAE